MNTSRTPRKILCSIGTGPFSELLEVSAPTFADYAQSHGYELDLRTEIGPSDRPVSWSRIPLIQSLLATFDLVLWIDADAVVVDASLDIADRLGPHDLMGMVAHVTTESIDPVPNCGVWILRADDRIGKLLDQVWDATQYVDHKWWENAAVMDRLGYELEPDVRLVRPTPMFARTRFLSNEWNSIPADPADSPRIAHFPGDSLDDRLQKMESAVVRPGSRPMGHSKGTGERPAGPGASGAAGTRDAVQSTPAGVAGGLSAADGTVPG